MPNCSICGNPVPKVPVWLDGTKITFRCNACPGSTLGVIPTFPALDEDDSKDEEVIADVEVESLEALAEGEEAEDEDED